MWIYEVIEEAVIGERLDINSIVGRSDFYGSTSYEKFTPYHVHENCSFEVLKFLTVSISTISMKFRSKLIYENRTPQSNIFDRITNRKI